MVGRNDPGDGYRYGFNGMEKDDEVKGSGNSYDFGARMYDSRLARFLSIDPKQSKFPWMSPYVFAANSPIRFVDVNGEGPGDVIKKVSAAINNQANKAWENSFFLDNTVTKEQGFVIVEKKTVIEVNGEQEIKSEIYAVNFQTGLGNEGIIKNFSTDVALGEVITGTFHTHPYEESQGGMEGVAFSAADISRTRQYLKKDFVQFVDAGSQRFALIVTDVDKASEFLENNGVEDIRTKYDLAFHSSKGTFQEKSKQAVAKVLGDDSGIEFHESTDTEKSEYKRVRQLRQAKVINE
jgi:RHS repeat-associated protein